MNDPVLLTGAMGRVGQAILDGIGEDYEWRLLAHNPPDHEPAHPYEIADVVDEEAMAAVTDGVGAIIHLAGDPRPSAPWDSVLENNVHGTKVLYQAAVENDVDRFVYASSNHAVGMYEVDGAPEIYHGEMDLTVDHTVAPRPDSMYGIEKVYGEGLCRLAADAHGLRCYALRICAVRSEPYDHPYGDAEAGVEAGRFDRGDDAYAEQVARMKCMWHSRRDLGHLVDRCLRDDSVSFDIFYGLSDNDRRWFDIEHAREVLGYDPQDNGEAWAGPPE